MGNSNSLIILAIFVLILYLAASGKLTQIVAIIHGTSTSSAPYSLTLPGGKKAT